LLEISKTTGKFKCRPDILYGNRGIILNHPFWRVPCTESTKNGRHHDTRPPHDWLPVTDRWIDFQSGVHITASRCSLFFVTASRRSFRYAEFLVLRSSLPLRGVRSATRCSWFFVLGSLFLV